MTVNLTRIYTKLGDGGETHLGDMSRVSKLHPRVEAYGTVDELNSVLGVALAQPGLPARLQERLRRVQNDLLDLGADLSVPTPPVDERSDEQRERLRIAPGYTEWLEQACDEVNAKLPPLRSFVIPGGSPAAAPLHVCRVVCRRAERRALAVQDVANPEVVRYLNRLSDPLFILARAVSQDSSTRSRRNRRARGAPPPTQPAGNRSADDLPRSDGVAEVCRRAERRVLAVEDVNPETVRYLNRLSDLLFILARAVNQGPPTHTGSEPLWDPGAHEATATPER